MIPYGDCLSYTNHPNKFPAGNHIFTRSGCSMMVNKHRETCLTWPWEGHLTEGPQVVVQSRNEQFDNDNGNPYAQRHVIKMYSTVRAGCFFSRRLLM